MKTMTLSVLALLAALPAAADSVAWEKSFSEAKIKAALDGKLLYVDFYTDW